MAVQDDLDRAVTDISAMDDVADGAIALMNALTALVKANINNPAALQAALTTFEAKKDALAAAVVANTPAADTPPATPPTTPPPGPTSQAARAR